MTLIGLRAACAELACRDTRTARRRLAALGVPVVPVGGRVLVDRDALRLAVRGAAVHEGTTVARTGVVMAPGARLWD